MLGRSEEARERRDAGAAIVRDVAEHASDGLRDAFLARPDVAELLT